MCRLLMEEASRTAAAQAATLRVYRDNPAACAVYTELGFVEVEAESTTEVLWMEKQISHAG
ncbi:hypothetical protein LT85_3270 [Collimonas arenae]|uniref:N-acetyltransferase domain-containing protein n=1 Tax=Collimonas arenae TaxID=279058 RepID=A0A0A1FCE6_9BURK|nr:hypothetical protein LT85_3270 [Collimonas arenae]